MGSDSSAQIEERAADWIARRAGTSWSPAAAAELNAWLAESTAHKVAFLRLEAVWNQANRLKALAVATPVRRPPERSPRSRRLPLAAAVLLASGLAAGGYFWANGGLSGLGLQRAGGSTFHTSIGAVSAVPLPDGSKVTLNTDSQIQIAVTERERRVNLGRGEAFFEVASDPARPFVVVAGRCKVIALGTKFSVWRAANEVRIVVAEGRVRVERGAASTLEPAEELGAGAVAHAAAAGVLIERKPLSAVEADLSWRRGFLFFHDAPLSEAVAEFNRYNREQLVIASPAIGELRIGGNFRSTNVAGFVRLLQDGFAVQAQRQGDRILLTGG